MSYLSPQVDGMSRYLLYYGSVQFPKSGALIDRSGVRARTAQQGTNGVHVHRYLALQPGSPAHHFPWEAPGFPKAPHSALDTGQHPILTKKSAESHRPQWMLLLRILNCQTNTVSSGAPRIIRTRTAKAVPFVGKVALCLQGSIIRFFSWGSQIPRHQPVQTVIFTYKEL